MNYEWMVGPVIQSIIIDFTDRICMCVRVSFVAGFLSSRVKHPVS
jgi:hypothetical protein